MMKSIFTVAAAAVSVVVAIILGSMEDPRHFLPWARYTVDHVMHRAFGDFDNTEDNLHCVEGRDSYFRNDPIFGNTLDKYPEDKYVPHTPMTEVPGADIVKNPNLLKEVSQDFSRPVIIRNFLQDSQAWKYLTLEWLAEEQGDEIYSMFSDSRATTPSTELATMKTFYKNITDGGSMYMTDTGWGFRHPDIVEDMDLHKLGNFPLPRGDVPFTARALQPFLGGYATALPSSEPGGEPLPNPHNSNNTVSSGFAWHCAPTHNAFVLFQGEKYWKIIDPKYQAYLTPNHQRGNQFATSCPIANKEFWEADLAYQNIPRWEGHVKSGDVLFNPAWFWHHVRNIPSAGPVLSFTTRHNYIPHDFRNNFMFAVLAEFVYLPPRGKLIAAMTNYIPGSKGMIRLLVETFNLWDRLAFFQPTVKIARAKGWSPENNTAIMKKMGNSHGATTGGGGTKVSSFTEEEVNLYNSGFDPEQRLYALKVGKNE